MSDPEHLKLYSGTILSKARLRQRQFTFGEFDYKIVECIGIGGSSAA